MAVEALLGKNTGVLWGELGSLISAGQSSGGSLVWFEVGRCKDATCRCGKNLMDGYWIKFCQSDYKSILSQLGCQNPFLNYLFIYRIYLFIYSH